MMFFWISVVPPSIELARERRKECPQAPPSTAHSEPRPSWAYGPWISIATSWSRWFVSTQVSFPAGASGPRASPRRARAPLQPEAQGEAPVQERGEPPAPAVVAPAARLRGPEDLRLVHAHVVEEDLVELGVAGDLPARLDAFAGLDRDAGQRQVEEEVGDALVPGRGRVGAGQKHHPVGELRERGPHLLTVEHPVLAVLHRAR